MLAELFNCFVLFIFVMPDDSVDVSYLTTNRSIQMTEKLYIEPEGGWSSWVDVTLCSVSISNENPRFI